jgi:hypothetical protein
LIFTPLRSYRVSLRIQGIRSLQIRLALAGILQGRPVGE